MAPIQDVHRPARAGRLSGALAAAVALSVAGVAGAEPTAEDRAAATALFKEGRELMAEKRWTEACRKLEESERLDPGGGTLYNVGVCHEGEGKTATAWAELHEALGIARRDNRADRIALASERVAALESRLTRLSIVVPSASDRPDLEIRRDGSVLGRAAWGTAIPVDPGKHTVQASAPGRVTWTEVVVVEGAGASRSIEVPPLAVAPTLRPSASASVVSAPLPPPVSSEPPPARPVESDGTRRTVGWALAGGSAAALVVGSYFGLRALSKHHESDKTCKDPTACDQTGATAEDSARTAADVSTVSFAIGLAAAGIGTYLLLSAPSSGSSVGVTRIAPAAARDGGGLAVGGRF